eukprot:1642579-Rhodomonas_salina.6
MSCTDTRRVLPGSAATREGKHALRSAVLSTTLSPTISTTLSTTLFATPFRHLMFLPMSQRASDTAGRGRGGRGDLCAVVSARRMRCWVLMQRRVVPGPVRACGGGE